MRRNAINFSYDPYDAYEAEIESLKEEGMTEEEATKEVRREDFADLDSIYWDDFLSNLQDALGETTVFLVSGSNIGWRHLSGSGLILADSEIDLLKQVLPSTSDIRVDATIFRDSVDLNVSHYGTSGSESYTITPYWKILQEELRKLGKPELDDLEDLATALARSGKLTDGVIDVMKKTGNGCLLEPLSSQEMEDGVIELELAGYKTSVQIKRLVPAEESENSPSPGIGFALQAPRSYPDAWISPSQLKGIGNAGQPEKLGDHVKLPPKIDNEWLAQ